MSLMYHGGRSHVENKQQAIAARLAAAVTSITATQSPGTWLCSVPPSSDVGDNPADHSQGTDISLGHIGLSHQNQWKG